MNTKIKKRWIEALRSGEYEQTDGYLKVIADNETRYCCLGVLCELYIESKNRTLKKKLKWKEEEHGGCSIYGKTGRLSAPIKKWCEIDGKDSGERNENLLVDMNDRGDSFKKIATYIEKNL